MSTTAAICVSAWKSSAVQTAFTSDRPASNEKQTKRLLQDLRTRYRSSGVSIALGYIVRQAPIENLDEVLSEADYNMYRDKQRIYGTSRRDRRR